MLAVMGLTTGWFLMGLQFHCRAHGASAEVRGGKKLEPRPTAVELGETGRSLWIPGLSSLLGL